MRAKTKYLLILFILFLFLPDCLWAAAEEAGQEGWGWLETFGRWFNLAVLFGAIFYFAGPALRRYFQDRRQRIQEQMQAAERAQAEAQAKLARIEQRLANLDEEIALIREDARRQAEAESARILEQAEQEASKVLANAEREIQGMSRSAVKQLKRQASRLAVELAEKKIRKDLSGRDDSRLIDDFFESLPSRAEGKRPS